MSSTAESLADLVRSYLDDAGVALRPNDPVAEARLNTWCFSVATAQVDVAEVLTALIDVTTELRRRLSGRPGPATFYAWYDEQTGQLRCSLASAPSDRLPFGAPYRAGAGADVAEEVLRRAGRDPHPGVVPWDEVTPATLDEDADARAEVATAPFPVWAVPVAEF
jgi:hypothetical protein